MAGNDQPIIIKKVVKKGHGGHHGGAWKVAYADFTTSMMAFFMLLWLLNVTPEEKLGGISDYFKNPQPIIGKGKVIPGEDGKMKILDTSPPSESTLEATFETLEDKLREAVENAIAQSGQSDLAEQILIESLPEGIRIQMLDKDNRPMFRSGSATMEPYAHTIIESIGQVIKDMPYKVAITGHTDATPFRTATGYSNWELSSDRANAARKDLEGTGVTFERFSKVIGYSSTVPFKLDDPYHPANRRIGILILRPGGERLPTVNIGSEAFKKDSGAVKNALGQPIKNWAGQEKKVQPEPGQ
ncbi:MAG: OmpA family protein [Nitrospirota bacterium]|nr:OmpA family protein [Nitrospirota bacterium]